jgi:hypothetical protein
MKITENFRKLSIGVFENLRLGIVDEVRRRVLMKYAEGVTSQSPALSFVNAGNAVPRDTNSEGVSSTLDANHK